MATKILVVDDEPDVSSLISQQYENTIAGFEVEFFYAYNGLEALTVLEQHPDIDIVLTDINMPLMDGIELLSNINKRWPLIKVIVVSAYYDMKNIRSAMNQGAFDFVTKPIEFSDLDRTVANAIRLGKDSRIKAYEKMHEHEKLIEIEQELQAARTIQSAFFPTNFEQFFEHTDFEIYGTVKPAKEVGGDFFDFFIVDESNIGLVIADVSGKGVPAALFMTMTRAALRCFSSTNLSECLKQTNEFLCNRNDSCMFVTLFYGLLNISTKEFKYCNAGHTPPLILSKEGTIQELGRNQGLALGISEIYESKEQRITLKNDDSLIFYTDGITEAMNSSEEMFTEKRLKEFLAKHASLPAKELINELGANVQAFVNSAKQSDDITIFCLKSLNSKNKR
jgi:sigma-B regulation protein RsbU (phosphoserine phosphatase)